jgi:hypothetical protein
MTMRRWRKTAAVLVATLVLAAGVLLAAGPERLWAQFGRADQGNIDFATLVRRDSPNDALACLAEFCAAKADVAAPLFARPVGDVFLAVQNAVVHEAGLEQVGADAGQGTLRFVQRTKLMKFPDTVNVKVVPTARGGSAVLIYSRSLIGEGDLGVNVARVKRWAELIEAEIRKDQPSRPSPG